MGADLLRTRKPSLIVVSISSFGQTGPSVGIAGHDLSIQGAAGMLKIPLGEEAAAALPVLPLADISSAMFAALGIVTALFDRSKTGVGTAIDVSMLDSLVSWMAPFLVPPMNNLPTRALPPDDPGYGIFATADARQITLSIAGEDHMWATLCAVLELPALAALNEQQRSDQRRDITPLLRSAILRWPCDALCQRLEAERIAFGPVLQLHEVLTDAQMVARGMAVELHSDGCNSDLSLPRKPRIFVRQPLLMDGTQPEPMLPVPALGQHNIAILGKLHGA
ncbi:CoA transferase [Roseateles sp. GG27B]